MEIPERLRYTTDHEWVEVHGAGRLRVGITDYAQDALGDVVFIDLPGVGTVVTAGQMFGEIESTKSVSELYAPVTGTVVVANDSLADDPSSVNGDPYGAGWICEIEISGSAEEAVADLMDADAYRRHIEG